MTSEKFSPEMERNPGDRLFNVDNLSDEQLLILWRSLTSSATELHKHWNTPDKFDADGLDVCDALWESLVAESGDLAARNPERIKRLVGESARSERGLDREFAARVAPYLIHQDYEFTRDVLVALNVRLADSGVDSVGSSMDYSEVAVERTKLLMRDVLADAQIADFNMHLVVHGEEHEIGPARAEDGWYDSLPPPIL